MSQLLSHISLSSLGETCASYIDHVATSLSPSLQTLHHQLTTTLSSAQASSPLRFLTPWPELIAEHAASDYTAPVAYTLLACAIAVIVMSSWRPSFNFWRRSPNYTSVQNPPHVTDSDYSYITTDEIVNPLRQPAYGHQYAGADDAEPDTILLKHRKNTYDLHFPAYAINEGALSVGQLRQRAAEVTRTPDPKRIRLLYKGKLLDNDSLPCRAEGLKQQSEVLCVVSEVQPGVSSPSETSEAEVEPARPQDPPPKRSGKNKKRGNKGKKPAKQADSPATGGAAGSTTLAPPAQAARPSASPSRSAMPSPAPSLNAFRTPLDQANGLLSYLHRELLPLCEEYFTNPPTDPKARDFEHKKLSETILAQVILKADGIEITNDEDRAARRALVKEAQTLLGKLDQALNN
ncbi:uncharacterized protein BO97DRAFT_373566 [Aspergillus homomorphus CBS 101889]|uniref:BAG domain-containing protein n=1 Tax=Aspergillus homomorphus (strain CBS 101889) TaxID=1450537 RepID=A0A395HR82_ASPHC|nr:hypothetical protein BO97DRAFT_373566 [Aspergillus homomorphus CBS 101889]RAL09933.1 hypothetical protein BO97DRAFT_373566 [Aspergillus homomorphus CBS 101889]